MDSIAPPELLAARAGCALLDVRDPLAFAAGHLEGSGHIPAAELAERRGELPQRDAAVLVIAAGAEPARAAAAEVEALGYARVLWLAGGPESVPGAPLVGGPPARLWRPSPFLEEVLPLLPDPRLAPRRVLDLAAGAGREAVFMAMQGYRVDAWDHDREVLEKASAMAARHGVTLTTCTRDLETRDPQLPVATHDVVMVFRFLHRPLLPRIARAVAPGGWVVYETYLRGQERFGRPKHPRFLLDPGELPRHFPGFEVHRHDELTPEAGPYLARLLARRPEDSSAAASAP